MMDLHVWSIKDYVCTLHSKIYKDLHKLYLQHPHEMAKIFIISVSMHSNDNMYRKLINIKQFTQYSGRKKSI